MGWLPLTLLNARKIVRRFRVDLVFASCPPVTAAIIGVLLKKLTGARLVIDFQDPWRGNSS